MTERETRVSYKAIASFAQLHRELRKTREELAKTQAAEKAYNATSAKDKSAATKASIAKGKALTQERLAFRDTIKLASRYATVMKGVTTNTRTATLAIQAQNRALKSNALNLTKAAQAAREYANAQKSISRSTGISSDAVRAQKELAKHQKESAASLKEETREVRKNAEAKREAKRSNVQFVESVGQVDTSTGEVIESTEEVTRSTNRWAEALNNARSVMSRYSSETRSVVAAQKQLEIANNRHHDATENLRIAELRLAELRQGKNIAESKIAAAELAVVRARRNVATTTDNVRRATEHLNREANKLPTTFRTIDDAGTRLFRSLKRFGDWRPRLVPPFIALIPIIGAVVAAINPLLALFGALGSAAIGLAGSIGSLSGAFLALPGILSGVAAGIASVIASMGGVGNVFKTYSAMQKATNSAKAGSTGPTQAERADALADAEWNLSKAQRSVQKAQENLTRARERALKNLVDLRLEVSRASMNEERAVANLRKAQEAYWNVMADPGSTLGDKLDAAASIKEAEADLQDVRKKNIDNQKALNEAEKKGIKNSDEVLDAQEQLTDALHSQRDAQRALRKEQSGGAYNAAAVQATNEYQKALDALSPSARKFVLAILAMQGQWKAFRLEMQEAFFSEFVNDLDRLPRLLRTLRSFLLPSASAMGEFVSKFMQLVDSPAWSRDMETIGRQNAEVIRDLGDGALSLSTALKDIVIAAGPFTDWMTTGFAKGARNFRDFVGSARETGRLANWLDTVRVRMQKWWQVVKNVGATIFNYSAAAQNFGGWLLDGFVKMSDGWKKASEEARKEGSPFQEYLENIKPLLSEVKGLFGDFFGWLSKEMMDPDNIKDAQDLVKLFRDELGPALGRFLDALSATEIDEKFVKALSSIVESLAVLMENGGGQAFEAFFDVLEGFFSFLADTTENIDPNVLEAILKFLGTVAAISFIGKFTGIQALLGMILGFNGKSSLFTQLGNFFKGFKGLDKLKFSNLIGKGGLLTLLGKAGVIGAILTLVGAGASAFKKRSDNGFYDTMGSTYEKSQNGTLTKKDYEEFRKSAIKDGNLLGTGGLGVINEILYGLDDLLGTKMGEGFTSFLEDTSENLINWVEDDLVPFFDRVKNGWNKFWEDLGTGQFWTNLGEEFGTQMSLFGLTWKFRWDALKLGWDKFWEDFSTGKLWQNIGKELTIRGNLFALSWKFHWDALKIGWDKFWADLKTGKLWDNIGKELSTRGSLFALSWKFHWNAIVGQVNGAVESIKKKWGEIQAGFAGPVNWVISNVWNKGVVNFWNGMARKLGWKTLSTMGGVPSGNSGKSGRDRSYKYASGGVLPGYTPGRDVHDFVSPTGGRLSLSGGEAIMRPEFTKLVGGKKGVDEINRKARKGEAFAKGGVWTGGKPQAFAGGGVWEVAGDLWDRFSGLFKNPLKYVKDGFLSAIGSLKKGIPNSDYGRMVSKLPAAVGDALGGYAKSKTDTARRASPSIPSDGKGMKWEAMWRVIRSAFPKARLHSGYRSPGKNSAVGGSKGSYHTRGRAIDVTPSMEIFNWIRRNYPGSRELIYSPAGGQQLLNGKNHLWSGAVRAMHYNHVHWAMKKGGVIPGLYDKGGWLPHGGLAVNQTGKPEAVLDPMESRALKALLSGSGLGATPVAQASAAVAPRGVAPVYDYSVNIEHLDVHNPVPEKMSESLPRSIRRIGYMNEARSR